MHCYEDVANGLFTDQRWCDLVPAFFAGTHILRDPGYNVASWNLSQRPIAIDADGVLSAAGSPLKFFHFTKVDHVGEVAIEHYAGDRMATFELLAWYRNLLAHNQPQGLPERYWAYGVYADGAPILAAHRQRYRADAALRARLPNPFHAGAVFRDHP